MKDLARVHRHARYSAQATMDLARMKLREVWGEDVFGTRYRWRQMMIAAQSCRSWHVSDRLRARWLLRELHDLWRPELMRKHLNRPIAGPLGRLP